MKDSVLRLLSAQYPWKDRFHYYPTIGSTNDQLRTMARQGAPEGTVLLAGHQSNGHGRRGRSFHSPEGVGIYLSVLLRPQCQPTDLMHLTCAAAVAACNAVGQAAGFRPGIKWTNDVVFQKKKLGGILTELGFTSKGTLDYAIVGIGINCCQNPTDFPEEIRGIATSLSMVSEKEIDRSAVAAALMDALQEMNCQLLTGQQEMLRQYRSDCITIGQDISLVRGEEIRYGKALDVDDSGALVVSFADGRVEAVNSGEVSVRGMYGYL